MKKIEYILVFEKPDKKSIDKRETASKD